jgi:hypothetical protein
MSTPTRDELLLHFGAEVAATRRRLNVIDKQWARTAKTPAELEEARCAVMLNMAMLRRLKRIKDILEGDNG